MQAEYDCHAQTLPARSPSVCRMWMPWKLLAACSAILLLLGYLILSVAFGRPDERLHINLTATTGCAIFFIGVSYAASAVLAVVQRNKKIFLLHSLFMPYMISNLLALFNVLLNILSRDLFPLTAVRVVGIGLPSVFAAFYGLAAFWVFRKNGPISDREAEAGTPLLDEEEMQRRQLFRLLQERNADSAATSDLVRNTYRLDLPVGVDPVYKGWDRYDHAFELREPLNNRSGIPNNSL